MGNVRAADRRLGGQYPTRRCPNVDRTNDQVEAGDSVERTVAWFAVLPAGFEAQEQKLLGNLNSCASPGALANVRIDVKGFAVRTGPRGRKIHLWCASEPEFNVHAEEGDLPPTS